MQPAQRNVDFSSLYSMVANHSHVQMGCQQIILTCRRHRQNTVCHLYLYSLATKLNPFRATENAT